MRVLVVQNFDNEGLGQIGAALAEAGADIDLRKPYRGETLPDSSEEHDAIVVLGGAQNALDDEICPYFPALLELTRDFADTDRSVLGICLGSQLLARAYGGSNQIGGATEFGWHKVSLTPAAKSDPVLAALPENFPIFEWHDDTFGLPENAVRLAGSAVAENQAFRLGRAAYGFQFHFEADTPMVRDWSTSFAEIIAARHPDWNDRLAGEIERNGPDADSAGIAIARAWVATI
ncbi:GMP synthase [Mesorhizobium sp. M00.F.Ca.ET.186.01.1.1]|nr:GMP synthase [bacterium M00.F.Ca.ET.205.01.1.1]TGU49484.1 GMP synthase [bacterium M00.F.Ca.ET.152.01.1.1]TGV33585.1 GMP synthase [Mesorhizobium sp. M00.F.Ca.ET.186.01.1.1]TGZ40486.1 GMP synthase [bacterium M00.F.Ca.ET.162.01.1.1]TIW63228.1 MAG: GMP synthase [Mesorhizobium sp.]